MGEWRASICATEGASVPGHGGAHAVVRPGRGLWAARCAITLASVWLAWGPLHAPPGDVSM